MLIRAWLPKSFDLLFPKIKFTFPDVASILQKPKISFGNVNDFFYTKARVTSKL